MIVDGRTISNADTVDTDILIIGGGPVGLILAAELEGGPWDVCVIESGDFQPDTEIQSLNDLGEAATGLMPRSDSRWRQVGGTAHIWNTNIGGCLGARYLPLDAIDFERREWLQFSGWPFSREAIKPYYRRAETLLGLGPFEYTVKMGSGPLSETALPLNPDFLVTTREQLATNYTFVRDLPDRLRASSHQRLITNSSVVELRTSPSGNLITHAEARCLSGTRFQIKAKAFLLATGAIENSRLLLASNRDHAGGLGNAHDQVGRFYMDRHRLVGGRLHVRNPEIFRRNTIYDRRQENGQYVDAKVTLSDTLQKREHILNCSAALIAVATRQNRASVRALMQLPNILKQPARAVATLRDIGRGLPYLLQNTPRLMLHQRSFRPSLADGGWSYLPNRHRDLDHFRVIYQIEQSPDPENRIFLTGGRDDNGMPRASVQIRLNDTDLDSIGRAPQIYRQQLLAAGVGELRENDDLEFPPIESEGGIHHHLGGTRMHVSPKQGVVDANARVHDVGNLWIGGGSVFPTGGYANPTLTILALTIRLADQVKREFQHLAAGVAAAYPSWNVMTSLVQSSL